MILKIIALLLAVVGSSTFLTKNNFSEFYFSNENLIIIATVFLLAIFMMKTIIRLAIFAGIIFLVTSSGYLTNVSLANLDKDSISESYDKIKTYISDNIN